ncbi:MAG: hypothetical protein H5U06_02840 [Candidatus Aminicenantes bacterium]|nr:hypothetical protein [Candidatus Aminicenantes bacterium]
MITKDNLKAVFSLTFIITICFIGNEACTPEPKLSPMQIRQITTRLFDSDYETVFRATITVLQDQGYIIKNTDMDSGLIVASIDKETSAGSQLFQALMFGYVANKGKEYELSCMVNKLSEKSTEIRLNIHETKYGQVSALSGSSKINAKQIYDQKLFNALFNEIDVEVKRREAMKK